MVDAVVVRGRFTGGTFVPEEPLPVVEGTAQLIVFPAGRDSASIRRLHLRSVRQSPAVAVGGGHCRSGPGRTRRLGRVVIYADTNVVIRLLEGDALTRAPIETRLLSLRGTGRFLMISRLTRLECRVKPLRNSDAALLALYDAFFKSRRGRPS